MKCSRSLVLAGTLLCVHATLASRNIQEPHSSHGQERLSDIRESHSRNSIKDWCPLPAVRSPKDDGLQSSEHFNTPEVLRKQVERLSSAVRVPTESFDDNGEVDEDPRWASFDKFHAVLKDLFPLVHSRFRLRKVNRYGLLYTLPGSIPNLKPILLTAHQDVVPAGSPSLWTHPPFSPYFDGTFLWGRGSTDCKNVLIGILSALESLLAQSFSPRRTIVLAFGFDEETGGVRGAASLAREMEDEWGRDAFAFLLDEGGMGLQTMGGNVTYALPGVAEKGYHDVVLKLQVVGGHSSKPPPHTAIGVLAEMVVALEKEPFRPRLTLESPYRKVLECKVKYSSGWVQGWLKEALESREEQAVAERLAREVGEERWLMQTSQAVDIIVGGAKINALPEEVKVSINHRIVPHESMEFVNEHVRGIVTPIAQAHGIQVEGDGSVNSPLTGKLSVDYPQSLAIAPISPTDNHVWELFSGTLRHVFESTENDKDHTVVPVGDIMTGNTDTQYYWNLTRNIYRFSPARDWARLNTHATDERMGMEAHVEGMKVYYDLIRNFDAWAGEQVHPVGGGQY